MIQFLDRILETAAAPETVLTADRMAVLAAIRTGDRAAMITQVLWTDHTITMVLANKITLLPCAQGQPVLHLPAPQEIQVAKVHAQELDALQTTQKAVKALELTTATEIARGWDVRRAIPRAVVQLRMESHQTTAMELYRLMMMSAKETMASLPE